MECILENDDGTKAVVMCGHEKKTFKSSVQQSLPPASLPRTIVFPETRDTYSWEPR